MDVSYSKTFDQSLLYSTSPKFLEAITERRAMREIPRSGSNNVKAGSQITIEISNDAFIDPQTCNLVFDLGLLASGGASASTTSAIANATDVIQAIQIYYNEQLVDDIKDANSWSNIFILNGCNVAYVNSEANALMGMTNQFSSVTTVNASNKARTYSVPLCLVSGFMRARQYIPLLGNKIRIVITVASNIDVISFLGVAGDYYVLSNVNLLYDSILTSSKYREDILNAMATPSGIRIPYTSYQTGELSVVASTVQNLKITNSNSNSLSLHILHSPEALKVATVSSYMLCRESYPLDTFSGYTCRSGSRYFTPPDGVKNLTEAYVNVEKTISSFCDLSGSGVVNYNNFVGTYTPATTIAGGSYGLAVLSANLEKAIANDDDVLNQGLSANSNGASNDFDIQIKTASPLASTSLFLYNLVHRRCLTFMNSGVAVEF